MYRLWELLVLWESVWEVSYIVRCVSILWHFIAVLFYYLSASQTDELFIDTHCNVHMTAHSQFTDVANISSCYNSQKIDPACRISIKNLLLWALFWAYNRIQLQGRSNVVVSLDPGVQVPVNKLWACLFFLEECLTLCSASLVVWNPRPRFTKHWAIVVETHCILLGMLCIETPVTDALS